MWNQASASTTSGAGAANTMPGATGGSYTNMPHTPGSFAQHAARPNNTTNSPSAHRRAGGLGPSQHASPSNNPAFPRPFANVAFPGTVSAPRSAAPPNTASVPQRSIQNLPLLTARTPASLAKLTFPPHTTVFWHRLQPNHPEAAVETNHDPAAPATTSLAASSDEVCKTWQNGVQDVVSCINKVRSRLHDTQSAPRLENAGIQLLLRDPLIYTSSSRSSRRSSDALTSESTVEMWLFVASTDDIESGSNSSSTNAVESAATSSAQPATTDSSAADIASKDAAQPSGANTSSSPIDPKIARQLPSDLAKALARLAALATVSSGSYALSSAAPVSAHVKGKQSSLTSEQRQAHKRFMASIKTRLIDSILRPSPTSKPGDNGKGLTRTRLRLGENIVFLPPQTDASRPLATTSDAAWFAASGHASSSADGRDHSSLITELDVKLCTTGLFVRATSRRLAALPLAKSRHANMSASIEPASARPIVLLAPLGCQAELAGVVPTNSIADEHLVELRSLFAALNADTINARSGEEALFASGLAICTLPSQASGVELSQNQVQPQHQQPQDPSFAHGETGDQVMDMSALSTIHQHEQAQPQQLHDKQPSRQFLWPVSWCLVVQDRRSAFTRTAGGSSAHTDLRNMQSQPMTPLKELVSFSLKVLNEANENTFAQNTAPYTPGEPDDASLSRQRMDRLPSTRPDITPASISFPDFDFAMPAAGSATPSQSIPAASQSVPGTSPAKREIAGADPAGGASGSEAFGDDLNWMQFLPPTSEGAASASVATTMASGTVDAAGVATSEPGAGPTVNALATGRRDTKATGSSWAFSTGSPSAPPPEAGAAAAAQAQSLLQPHGQMQSQGSTPFQGQDTTPLGFVQPAQTKRKAGETDIFGNLGLLTEDDFSFFDESAFGLEPDSALSGPSGSLQQHLDRPVSASSNSASFGQPLAMGTHTGPTTSAAAVTQPTAPATTDIEDVAMGDLEQNSLDALFSAIPGLQDVMVTSEPSQAPLAPALSVPPSAATVTQTAQSRGAHGGAQEAAPLATSSSAHPFHPAITSFTPRDASTATPFGDPASLPGFTPSSLTESSPAFGNPNYKTPRTPYSPVEEYRDGATIVDLQNVGRMRDAAQGYRDRNAASAPDATGHHSISEHKGDAYLKQEDHLRLADASTAAAAAANAAMDNDASSRKRPAIVPSAFLPLAQPEARKPLQRLTAGARANLGRKYDLWGKFASKPKTSASITTVSTATTAAKAASTEQLPAGRTDRASAPEPGGGFRQTPLGSRFGQSPSKQPSRRGQALLQLRRDRNSKASPGSALINARRSSSQRMMDGAPATPRSSDDIAMSGVISATDSDSDSSGDEDSSDALSDTEGSVVTLSSEDQAVLKGGSREMVARYLCGASQLLSSAKDLVRGSGKSVPATSAASATRPTIRRWMLTRTAEWLVQNPQFRAIYGGVVQPNINQSDVAVGEKIEVLEAMASALSVASSQPSFKENDASSTITEAQVTLPTLQTLIKPSKPSSIAKVDAAEIAEILEPTKIAVGCQGSVVETLPSAMTLWDKSKLSAVSGQKHVVAKVLLTHASPAWHDEIVAWLERLRVAFESHGLGTHVGGPQSILAVADGSESLVLSSYLDQLWKDGETWLDTLRSISSRVQLDLLQGKHVVVYTLQPPNSASCGATGFHGLLRLETDLRAMLSEQVGVLAEQLLVRPVCPAMMTEGGSLGFSQQTNALRRLAFSVYDQLPRLVRRQPAKVLHGREAGPISAVVQFPSFSLSLKAQGSSSSTTRRTNFSLNWSEEPATALDEHVLLHISYRICQSKPREHPPPTAAAAAQESSFDSQTNVSGLGNFPGSEPAPTISESLVMVSAIDERAGSNRVDVLGASSNGDGSVEACIERVWRFALAEASRARVRWRLAIASAGLVTHREQKAWQRLIGAYLSSTDVKERVMAEVILLSVRADESAAILAERGARTRPNHEWLTATTTTTAVATGGGVSKENMLLLDASDFSQVVQFDDALPLGWTLPFGALESEEESEEDEEVVMPSISAVLVHKPRTTTITTTNGCHVLAVDLLQSWPHHTKEGEGKAESEKQAMDSILNSLHRLRLISEERHQLPPPFNAQPWPVAAVNTLASFLANVVVGD
ncbi:uncharacterized protein UTRI_06509 [Ustilago trichophora]|uniref:Mediator of RNA polymerase II transcription subunit 13 n=1 Tax=Ustilago trichophora TaxID=86804 RepID=A0A5C3EQ62_9BASI|nr:uncharacterized protein UTRI_06509 [Ustilago trichophora]